MALSPDLQDCARMISRKVVPDKYNSGTGTQKSMVFHAAGQVQASY